MSKRLKNNLLLSFTLLSVSFSPLVLAEIDRLDSDGDGMPDQWENAYGLDMYYPMDAGEDIDTDGVTNADEYVLGTNPLLSDSDGDWYFDNIDLYPLDATKGLDSDGDGLPDSWEVANGLDRFNTSDSHIDSDMDGLTAAQEYAKGTDPLRADTDQDGVSDFDDHFPLDIRYQMDFDLDGLPDKYENAFFFLDMFFPEDANHDFDGDGLNHITEFQLGTSPEFPDSDGDGYFDNDDPVPTSAMYSMDMDGDTLPDLWEMENGTNMWMQDVWEDVDLDGLTNLQEYQLGTKANERDSDGDGWFDLEDRYPLNSQYRSDDDNDGMPNEYEMRFGFDHQMMDDGGFDFDYDMLPNAKEFFWGTNPEMPDSDYDGEMDGTDLFPLDRTKALDSDNDGLPDSWEVINGLDQLLPDDAQQHNDGDTLTNAQEYALGTDPNHSDTDRDGVLDSDDLFPLSAQYSFDTDLDGLPDAYEAQYIFLDPHSPQGSSIDAQGDFDNDGLSNIREFLTGANPEERDSDLDGLIDGEDKWPVNAAYDLDVDGDGLPDNWEYQYGTDVFIANAHSDSDYDQLSAIEEFTLGTNPELRDTDGDGWDDGYEHFPLDPRYTFDSDRDGMPDEYEYKFGFSSHDMSDGGSDGDYDGLNNTKEYLLGTDPSHPDSDLDGELDGTDLFPLDRTKALDSDNDGLPDSWEMINGLDQLLPDDAQQHNDGDTLTNAQEYALGTDPNHSDTDRDGVLDSDDLFPLSAQYSFDSDLDGLPDAYEAQYFFLDPYSPQGSSIDAQGDFDNDGLSNIREFQTGANPEVPDSDFDGVFDGEDIWPTNREYALDQDGDGLPDNWEYQNGTDAYMADGHRDSDYDQLSAIEEFLLGTNPELRDTDGDGWDDGHEHFPLDPRYTFDSDRDGMPDEYEYRFGFSSNNINDGGLDGDYDGLNNAKEYLLGTDPSHPDSDLDGELDGSDLFPLDRTKALDSDNDGLPDSWEMINGLDQLLPDDAQQHNDGDTLTNAQEYALGTDPNHSDTDRDGVLDSDDLFPLSAQYSFDSDLDGLPDVYEAQYFFFDPYSPQGSSIDAQGDFDNDGLSNIREFQIGANPEVPDSDFDGVFDGEDIWPTNREYALDQDGDGLPDNWEYKYGTDVNRADGDIDSDYDRLSAINEFLSGTDPDSGDTDGDGFPDGDEHFPLDPRYSFDSDRDGMPDEFEYRFGLSPHDINDGGFDNDHDGLNNSSEFLLGTRIDYADTDSDGYSDSEDFDPKDRLKAVDSDQDGLPDVWEILNGGDPLLNDANFDEDNDGLSLRAEYLLGTNGDMQDTDGDGIYDGDDAYPLNPLYHMDSDNDGLPDAFEISYLELDEQNYLDAMGDIDGDGLTNIEEFQLGTLVDVADSDGDSIFDAEDIAPSNPLYLFDVDRDSIPDEWEYEYGGQLLFGRINDDDYDQDFVTDLDEYLMGTNPLEPDTDFDGMWDAYDHFPTLGAFTVDMDRDGIAAEWEIQHGTSDHDPYDALLDNDGNGKTNRQEFFEFINNSGQNDVDTDQDGMSDLFEQTYGLDINDPDDAQWDYDTDGLTNLEEFNAGTNPLESDSDFDTLSDLFEVTYGFDPTTNNGEDVLDSDGDGLLNYQEQQRGTNPTLIDTDGDTIADNVDAFPTNEGEWADNDEDGVGDNADLDDDNDGLSDNDEATYGTNPLLEDSDEDGFSDAREINELGTAPLLADTNTDGDDLPDSLDADDDNDGLSDEVENTLGSAPLIADTDGDTVVDGEDTALFDTARPIIRKHTGATQYGYFAKAITSLQDVNSDELDDYAIMHKNGVTIYSSADGSELLNIAHPANYNFVSLVDVGDLNQNGVTDILLGGILADGISGSYVYDGSTGEQIYSFIGSNQVEQYGSTATALGDVNGDEVADFMIGLRTNVSTYGVGYQSAQIISGATGAMLYQIDKHTQVANAPVMTGLGDVNGDGAADFAITYQSSNINEVDVYSGLDGTLLYTLNGGSMGQSFGVSLADIGDVDNDGIHDLAVGSSREALNTYSAGAVFVYSGATGAEVWAKHGTDYYGRLGIKLANVGDVDGDGSADLAVLRPEHSSLGSGKVKVLSGISGLEITSLSQQYGDMFGEELVGLGDINADGFADLLIGAERTNSESGSSVGAAYVVSFSGDNDQDGMPYMWETRFGLNPNDATDANIDSDGDGFTNLEEFELGTHPLDAAFVYSLDVSALSAPDVVTLNFLTTAPISYGGGQDKTSMGFVNVEDDGSTLHLNANRWQAVPLNYTVTPNTVLALNFKANTVAEILGLGFDNNLSINSNRAFRLAGSQNWGRSNYSYSANGEYQSFEINVGNFYTGAQNYVFFMCDDDRNTGCDTSFNDVNIYENNKPQEPYYAVSASTSWSDLALALYGSSDTAAQLQEALEGIYSLTAGEYIVLSDLPETLVVH
ncbi:hypothetical protein [Saccharophagus degradans]|uniref:Integrins alpha chain n=1 Tax=Saccharophagus degradans TaxID=86304 RepID=A0AAW7X5S4_9GAMM|nr:hypothetical protein [Saccharophagus degradans]MDO6422645.1 hypothetical protein [Saccharophagus degradans]MDO6609047.1 hypothetical protein [Saccharophagus degradans]